MDIVWVTSEATPYAKTGGLADVSASLPAALAERGHKVSVIMPYYPQAMKELTAKAKPILEPVGVPFGDTENWIQLREDKVNENLSYYFIEFNGFYDRPKLYDWNGQEYEDNAQRYIFFCRAAMQSVMALGLNPDILHTNDWHAALCNVYLKSHLYSDVPTFKKCRSVLSIHNIGYQGVYHKNNMYFTGLGWDYFNHLCLEFHDQINLLKAGICTADMVSTVSPKYAEEILSEEYGFNLHYSLQHRAAQGKLRGILNGIDVDEWSPEKDTLIPANFTAENLSGKWECKAELQKELGLEVRADIPLMGIVSRLAYQKGIDVLIPAIENLLVNDDVQFAIIGSGEYWLENALSDFAARFPEKFRCYIGYNNRLAHMVEAGCDYFLMPSRYEPCGLNQMYSMRYGTVPIVRATGGLDDTVINFSAKDIDTCTGFKFWDLYPDAVVGTMRWATSVYHNDKGAFYKMVHNGMTKDFSWDHTATLYEELYADANR
jgi:starch synthase